MSFFTQFPKIKYDINADGVKTDLTDMFRYVDVNEKLLDDIGTYTYYEIKEGERPDVISNRLYDTPDYYWTFFVINESLKQGLNTWPKSYRQFELMLEQNYSDYSTLVFIPRQYPVARKYENSFEMVNYFGGLDLNTGNVKLSSADDAPNGTKIEAEILRFDDQRFQLWVYNISNAGRFANNTRWKIVYNENPYGAGGEQPDNLRYTQFEGQRSDWAKSALEWTKLNQTTVYYAWQAYLNDANNAVSFSEGSDAYYNYFLINFFEKIVFSSHRFFENSYNAPSYFLDNENEGDRSTAFDAYSKVFSQQDVELPSNFFRGDIDVNVAASRLDGFDQSQIAQYNSISRQRKYIPSFVETYYSEQAEYVSIKEEQAEKIFQASKIRVVRPEHIDEFVELYQEKLVR